MKILIVNISDIQGGAARAAYRLHKALLVENVDSEMLVLHKHSDDFTVLTTSQSTLQKTLTIIRSFIESIPVRFYKNRTKTFFSPSFTPFGKIVQKINEMRPNIVHLHWVSGGVIRVEDFKNINVPIVWSLHDMWAFTGGCHYDEECGAFKSECGNCKVLGSTKQYDLSSKVFQKKKKSYGKIDNMTIVGLSNWIHESAKSSFLLKDKKHINLPNPINTDIFKPFSKELARELWSLPKDKKLILIGAMYATSDPRKGFDELMESLGKIEDNSVELVVFGSSEPKESQSFGFKTHYFGSLHDDISLVTLYSAVDGVVIPSLQENLSNVIMESLACATPVVGFNIGGNSDMIEHQING
ncbi:MAG TPA: glycosyltransferase, partial [Campylobacterales bacterium]|nr:glycosyltransferase [Campylobacterales bacterium]